MNKRNYYIPKLILRKFAENDKVNTFDVQGQCFKTQKLKNVPCRVCKCFLQSDICPCDHLLRQVAKVPQMVSYIIAKTTFHDESGYSIIYPVGYKTKR